MNHADLKDYAPQARRDFIQAVTDRAAFYGVTAAKIDPVTVQGDVAIIAGHAFPASVVSKRKKLVDRIERSGFNQAMEELAYTWFNRFVAIRFMEIHGYLEHGYRVLSHPDSTKTVPEILELAEHVDLPGLNKEKVIDLKLDGNKESELYQMLVLAQCHALHSAMPFLFEGIDDETELVLPENLLHSDSMIRKLVAASGPEDWQEVEVLGWLYQFYISERKDEVMARKSAVPTEDIPAVTQLFTPHWIVRYLVENSLGRLWLLNRPGSHLREHMPYYIEGEAETDFLKINMPEDIRLLDPACGSGHMLTYAFDLLFLIYEEEGYVPNEIPALILKHNLYGLEICPRAAQLAEMALVFKSRAKSPRFFQPASLIPPRILAQQNLRFEEDELRDYVAALDLGDLFNEPMLRLLHQFEEATTFGSLIQPSLDEAGIAYARGVIESKDLGGHLFLRETHARVLLAFDQAEMLCQRYHVVVTNPPYMGSGNMNALLKTFAASVYQDTRSDLFSMFIEQGIRLTRSGGPIAFVTLHNWMFLSSFASLRQDLLLNYAMSSCVHIGYNSFPELNSKVAQAVAFVIHKVPDTGKTACYFDLNSAAQSADKESTFKERLRSGSAFNVKNSQLREIAGAPIAYWLTPKVRQAFKKGKALGELCAPRKGNTTTDNARFLRVWFEVEWSKVGLDYKSAELANSEGKKWLPYNKGGAFRKWYGGNEFLVNWADNGREIKAIPHSVIANEKFFFSPGLTWTTVTSARFSVRKFGHGFIFDNGGCCIFLSDELSDYVNALLNSIVFQEVFAKLNPTLNFQSGEVAKFPVVFPEEKVLRERVDSNSRETVALARADWDNFETSWGFRDQPLLRTGLKAATLEASWGNWEAQTTAAICRMRELETENNSLFIQIYGLDDELTPEVPEGQITLARADVRHDIEFLLSYAVGCMMGRYSLDKSGLILGDCQRTVEQYVYKVGKPLKQLSFVPDEDGIIPVLDGEWFKGDIAARALAFLRATFGEATLDANLRFIEESLGKDLRKYFLGDFYKDHLQTYKKRPIYWLFSSGKERAFQALVYLHRYHEGTLSRMRTEYVIPLQGKIASRIDQLADDIQKATSTSHRKKMEKERDKLLRQRTELQAFDEKLRHYADQRIQLDLDDGVKVNYGKFGDLLAEVNAVTGGSDE